LVKFWQQVMASVCVTAGNDTVLEVIVFHPWVTWHAC